jgi:amino acid transporter
LIWGWVVVTFFTWFVGIAMAEICSSFPVYILISYIYIHVHFS